jgi:hypothetical protein
MASQRCGQEHCAYIVGQNHPPTFCTDTHIGGEHNRAPDKTRYRLLFALHSLISCTCHRRLQETGEQEHKEVGRRTEPVYDCLVWTTQGDDLTTVQTKAQ